LTRRGATAPANSLQNWLLPAAQCRDPSRFGFRAGSGFLRPL